jgi:hypothetical protein
MCAKANPSEGASSPIGPDSETQIKDREHFAISVPTSGIVVVENRKHDDPTTYSINVDESGETSACSCPADEYRPGKCKHRRGAEAEPAVIAAATATTSEFREVRQ